MPNLAKHELASDLTLRQAQGEVITVRVWSMPEVADTGERHREAGIVRGCDHFGVAE